jgi:hydroxymethylpyrimidine pyrophosphatase-like HAD family hydrolase
MRYYIQMTEFQNGLREGPRFNPNVQPDVRSALFDIDNTLVSNEGYELPSDRFIAAARAAGEVALVAVATARPSAKAAHIIVAAHMNGHSILSNGAQVFDGKTGEMCVERVLPAEATHDVVRTLQHFGIDHWVQDNGVDHRWLQAGGTANGNGTLGMYVRANDIWRPATGTNQVVVQGYVPHKPFVVVAHNIPEQQVKSVREIGTQYAEAGLTSLIAHETPQPDGSKTYEIFFLDKLANKKDALAIVSDLTRIRTEHTMAVGDGPNDEVIVAAAGIGVALENAVAGTKRVATHIAPSRVDDGAAIATEQLVLRPRQLSLR